MKILDDKNNLFSLLQNIKQKEVTLVSAFASGTEPILETLLENKNKVKLIIGTINYFSDPDFIEYCVDLSEDSSSFEFFVDFRINNSIHWKLYLISSNSLLIGSANFTDKGIKLYRDTCIHIKQKSLFDDYVSKIDQLIKIDMVMASDSEDFQKELKEYKLNHRRFQSAKARATKSTTLKKWLNDEQNHLVPLFIWETDHTDEDKIKGPRIFKEEILPDEELEDSDQTKIIEFTTIECKKGKLPYEEGDTAICVRNDGCHLQFLTFDHIIYKDGKYWLYTLRRSKYHKPFEITKELRAKVKKRVTNWHEKELFYLNRKELESLL